MEELVNEEIFTWYIKSSEWCKQNFLFGMLKLCSGQLINSLNGFLIDQLHEVDEGNLLISTHKGK